MFSYQNQFWNEHNVTRLSISLILAVMLHFAGLYFALQTQLHNKLSSDIKSVSEAVAVRLVSPQKPEQIIEKVANKKPLKNPTPKAIPKKVNTKKLVPKEPEDFNKIEPATAQLPQVRSKYDLPEPKQVNEIKTTLITIPVVKEPNIRGRRIQPEYPKRALRMRQEGVVLLRVLLDDKGIKQDIKLHQASEYALLNQAALRAVSKWSFDPSIINGKAVKSWVEIPIEFKIQ